MGGSRTRAQLWHTTRVLLALLCVLLVTVAGTLQVAHSHAGGAASHPECSLCATAHVGVQATVTPSCASPVAMVIARVPAVAATRAVATTRIFALFMRPPPAAVFPA